MVEGCELYQKEKYNWNSPSKNWGEEEGYYYG